MSVDDQIAEALTALRNQRYVWPQLWLDCYYDPTLSHEENCRLAEEAVADGWTPASVQATTPPAQADAPCCPSCGCLMQQTGHCFTCPTCGNNTGCG